LFCKIPQNLTLGKAEKRFGRRKSFSFSFFNLKNKRLQQRDLCASAPRIEALFNPRKFSHVIKIVEQLFTGERFRRIAQEKA